MDSVNSDCWLNFDSPMFALVDPNEICPVGILTETNQTQIYNGKMSSLKSSTTAIATATTTATTTTTTAISGANQFNNSYYIYDNAIPVDQTINIQSVESYQFQQQQFQDSHIQQEVIIQQAPKETIQLYTQDENYIHYNLPMEPPPMLCSQGEPKHQIQHHLSIHRVLSKQRQDKIRARLERQQAQLPAILTRKASGRKMTGRERQLELEKQEAHQLKLRSQYLDLINELEEKCSRLRQILENIVATSPEYNRQMLSFLENSNLLFDQEESNTISAEEGGLTSIEDSQSHS